MRKLLTILFVLASTIGAFAGTCGNGYTYSRKFTVPAAYVPNTDQTNFPVALAFNGASFFNNFYLPDLATVANSGKIQNTANNSITVSGPADFIFCDAASAGNSLKFEVANYVATTGKMEAYVNIPTLSHTTANSFWMFYGNVSVVTTQQDLSFWATASFKSVYHLIDGTTLGAKDSTGTFNGTITSANATTGALDGGMNMNGGFVDTGSPQNAAGIISAEMWLFPSSSSNNCFALLSNFPGSGANGYALELNPGCVDTRNPFVAIGNGGTFQLVSSTGTAPVSVWTHLATTIAGSGPANNRIFVNGAEPGYAAPSGSQTLGATTANLQFGQLTNAMSGTIDEVRISSVVRSPDWFATTYGTEYSPSTFSLMIDPTLTGPRIVQYVTCNSAQSAANPCPFSQNVVSGNTVVIVAANTVDANCSSGGINTLFTDTRSTTFTFAALGDNLIGGQPTTCIAFGVFGSSGAESITAQLNSASSESMVVYEIAGISSPSLDVTSNSTGGAAGSLSTGSATATTANSLLVCGFGGSSSGSQFYTSSLSPSNAAFLNTTSASILGATKGGTAAVQFTGSGSKSCTFTFGGPGPTNTAGALAVIKYSAVSAASKRRMAQVY
jgi:hypothetical protein